MWVVLKKTKKKHKRYRAEAKGGVGWWRWDLGKTVALLGEQGESKTDVPFDEMLFDFMIGTRPFSNWSVPRERWLPGTAVTRSGLRWCAPASSMTFLKMTASATESCHVEQSRNWQEGRRNQVTNLILFVTIYFLMQIDSLLKDKEIY